MWYIDVFGYLGGGFACIRFVPQIYKSYKSKSTKDLAWGLLILSMLSQTCTITYAFLIKSRPLIIPISIALFMTSTLVCLKLKYERLSPITTEQSVDNIMIVNSK
jgi:MtN3 and saliva related transmembrane protein